MGKEAIGGGWKRNRRMRRSTSGQFGLNANITAVLSMMDSGHIREGERETSGKGCGNIIRRQRNRRKGAGRMGDTEEGDVGEGSRVKRSSRKVAG